jgi:hypothetical protein
MRMWWCTVQEKLDTCLIWSSQELFCEADKFHRQETLCCGYISVLKCLLGCPKEVDERGGRVALQNITPSLNTLSGDTFQ